MKTKLLSYLPMSLRSYMKHSFHMLDVRLFLMFSYQHQTPELVFDIFRENWWSSNPSFQSILGLMEGRSWQAVIQLTRSWLSEAILDSLSFCWSWSHWYALWNFCWIIGQNTSTGEWMKYNFTSDLFTAKPCFHKIVMWYAFRLMQNDWSDH